LAQPYDVLTDVFSFRSGSSSLGMTEELTFRQQAQYRDLGLSFVSSVQHRFGEGLIEEDLSILNLQTYYRAGVEWDIIKNGWLSNVSSAELLGTSIEFEKINQREREKQSNAVGQIAFVEYILNQVIIEKLYSRQHLLRSKERLFRNLLERGYVTGIQMADFDKRVSEVRVLTTITEQSIEGFEHIYADELALVNIPIIQEDIVIPEILIDQIMSAMDESTSSIQRLELEKELVGKPFTWSQQIRFTANLNYHLQESFSGERRDFTSVGLRLEITLTSQIPFLKNEYDATLSRIEAQHEVDLVNKKRAIFSLYNSYQSNRSALTALQSEFKIIEQAEANLFIERSRVNTDMPANDLSLLGDDKLVNLIEQSQIIKSLIQLLIRMDIMLLDRSILEFIIYSEDMTNRREDR
jgi:hypothetical protein